MCTLHLVSHTHWDREWYLTFQQFRLKLVHVIDDLLDLLAEDIHYRHFTLDGQTIVLDDYLQIRPEREAELRQHVHSGRLLIGPWHILPDEFLVSPEATLRNLLQGARTAQRFGVRMMVGYIPDPFGHIAQMPQILRGFGIYSASVQRGLSDEACELWWQSPDGSRVLMAYLRDGYGNAAGLPANDPGQFSAQVACLAESLRSHAASKHLLLMHGTDHMPAQPNTSAAIAVANGHSGEYQLVHSTLPDYFAAMLEDLGPTIETLPIINGELRCSKRHPLLPNVLSTRMWIKQRNHACETLLEKWAEPFTVFASLFAPQSSIVVQQPSAVLRHAWRMLMECHPHDSICGCSIDQVHREMQTRFDQFEQIGEEITRQSLESLAAQVDTTYPANIGAPDEGSRPRADVAIIVFNSEDESRTEPVETVLPIAVSQGDFSILDDGGCSLPCQLLEMLRQPVVELELDRQGLFNLIGSISDGRVSNLSSGGMALMDIRLQYQTGMGESKGSAPVLHIYATLSDTGVANPDALLAIAPEIAAVLADESLDRFYIHADQVSSRVRFLAPEVPPHGYRTFWLRTSSLPVAVAQNEIEDVDELTILNQYFQVTASELDGSLRLVDLRSGTVFTGLNRFQDGGDRGDEYNYDAPVNDRILTARARRIQRSQTPLGQSLRIEYVIELPVGLTPGRDGRSSEVHQMDIISTVNLWRDLPRLEIHTRVENYSDDHRLRVHFTAPFQTSYVDCDGHFQVVRRSVETPLRNDADAWIEAPRPEMPQRNFSAISAGQHGLLIANRGLPEVEVLQVNGMDPDALPSSEIALTLLRCVGWLSRDDLGARRGHAGPGLPTTEAQMHGVWEFDYAIIPFSVDQMFTACHQAYAFDVPMRSVTAALHAGSLPSAACFINTDNSAFRISAIKQTEDNRGWIVRGYPLQSEPLQVNLTLLYPVGQARLARLDELPGETLHTAGNENAQNSQTFTIGVGSYQVVTLRLE